MSNLETWLRIFEDAYSLEGKELTAEDREVLLSRMTPGKALTDVQRLTVGIADEATRRTFWQRAAHGKPFGDVDRIRQKFGRSIEENYGISEGPFIDVARTYWTFKTEVADLSRGDRDRILYQLLSNIEQEVAAVFFPTPGPSKVDPNLREAQQRETLEEYAPRIDIERFLSESPILATERQSQKSGYGTPVLVAVAVIALLLWVFLG